MCRCGKGKEKNTIIGSVCEETSGPAPSQSPISSTDAPTTEAPTTGMPTSQSPTAAGITYSECSVEYTGQCNSFSISGTWSEPPYGIIFTFTVGTVTCTCPDDCAIGESGTGGFICADIPELNCPTNIVEDTLSDITAGNDCTQTDTTLTCQSNCQCIAGHDCPDNICCGNQICVDEYGKEGKRRILSSERFVSKGKGVL